MVDFVLHEIRIWHREVARIRGEFHFGVSQLVVADIHQKGMM